MKDMIGAFKETEIGPIPVDWMVMPLKEIAKVRYGKARPKTQGTVPVVGSGGVYAWVKSPLIKFSTLVIGRKGTAGRVWLQESPCWPSDTTFYLQWKREIDLRFLFGYMSLNPLSGEHAKTTLPSLQRPDLENYLIPLPPLPEQRRIAHVLSAIQRAIAAQDDLIAAARQVKRSMMERLFRYGPGAEPAPTKETEIGEVPAHWEVVRLKNIAEKPQYGYTQSASQKPVGPKFLRITDITESGVNWATVPYCECDQDQVEKYRLKRDDILFARTGATTGKSYMITDCPEAVFASYLIRVQTKSGVLPAYVYHFFNSTFYWDQITRSKVGSAQAGVNATRLSNLLIPVASSSEQQQIADTLSVVDQKITVEERRKAALQELFKSTLHQLMTRQIRVQERPPPRPSPNVGGGRVGRAQGVAPHRTQRRAE